MSYRDIGREIEDLYAFSASTATISAITDKVIPELKQWQQRPLRLSSLRLHWTPFTIKSGVRLSLLVAAVTRCAGAESEGKKQFLARTFVRK